MSLLDDAGSSEETLTEQSSEDKEVSNVESSWHENLNEDLLTEKVRRFGSVEDLVKSYNESQKLIGRKGLEVPADDAPDNEWEAFNEKLGVPKSSDQYQYDLGEESFLDEATLNIYKKIAAESGIPARNFTKMMAKAEEALAVSAEEEKRQIESESEATKDALKDAWGNKYDSRLKGINTLLDKMELDKEGRNFITDNGLGSNLHFLKFLDRIAQSFGESVVSRSEKTTTVNDEVRNLKAQRNATKDQVEYDRLHKQYLDKLKERRGVI